MKIIFLTELRGAHAELYILLKETSADLYLIGGNLQTNAAETKTDETGKYELPEYSEKNLKKYNLLGNVLSSKPYTSYCLMPGCGDIELSDTSINEYILNNSIRDFDSFYVAASGCPGEFCRDCRDAESFLAGLKSEIEKNKKASKPDLFAFYLPKSVDEYPVIEDEMLSIPESFFFNCRAGVETGVEFYDGKIKVYPRPFGIQGLESVPAVEGGYFYECYYEDKKPVKITLRKLYGERVFDIAEYIPSDNTISPIIIDEPRYRSMIEGTPFDSNFGDHKHIAEVRLFREIRNFLRIHQTAETEKRVELLHKAIAGLGDYSDKTALDLVGSANVGLSGEMSDIDTVIYIKAGTDLSENEEESLYAKIEAELKEILKDKIKFDIIDRINVDRVYESIINRDYECYETQLFAVYRAACRPINYRILSPVEDALRKDRDFQRNVEKSMKTHLQMFARTTSYNKSFDKYLNRLKTSGVKIPDHLEKKINTMLQKNDDLK